MVYIALFILFFTGIQLLVAASNVIFKQALPKSFTGEKPLVSVLIPARNEENNIGNLVGTLLKQNYKHIEILVFDDESTDSTAEIIGGFADNDKRIRLISSKGLPKGWLGKNFACHSLAQHASGSYFLFLDADVKIHENYIFQALSFCVKHQLGLLSVFPKQIMQTTGEYMSVPNMNYILLSLLPLILVRKTKLASLAAANGQFMLFNAETYNRLNPHERMKKDKAEDIKIAKFLKQENVKVACLSGNKNVNCRMYSSFREAIAGFSKNVAMFFGNSILLAILFWIVTTFGFLFVFFACRPIVFMGYLIAVVLIRILVSAASEQNILKNLILLIPQQISLGVIIYKAIENSAKKQFEWKGRNIS